MKAKYFGADGEVQFIAHRNVYIGFMGGKVVATRNNREAVVNYLAKFSKVPAVVTSTKLRESLTDKVKKVWTMAGAKWPAVAALATPRVEFYRKGTAAGKAYYLLHKVTFNEVLAEENSDKFDNTVIHECAHLVTRALFPDASGHGREFKMVMRALGGDGNRCHSYDVSSVKVVKTKTRFVYSCSCKMHQVTAHVHKATVSGKTTYRCKKCRDSIKFTGKVVKFQ